MPPTNRSKRHSPATRFSQLCSRIAELVDGLGQRLQANRRRRQLRRQRQQQQGSDPAAQQQIQALGRALKVRVPQRRRQRQQADEQTKGGLTALFWPRFGDQGFSSRHAAARLLRLGAAAILLLILISMVLNAVPLQLTSPSWYLQVLAYIAENVPALIIISIFALLSLALGKNDEASNVYLSQLMRLSRFGYILALLLLPLQLGFTAWLYGQAFSDYRTQLSMIRASATALISGADQTSTTEQFVAYLRSRNLSGNLESIAAAPLVQVKQEFIRGVQLNKQQQEQRLGGMNRTTMLRYSINSIKLFATLVVLAGFMRGFQMFVKRCSLGADQQQSGQLPELALTVEPQYLD